MRCQLFNSLISKKIYIIGKGLAFSFAYTNQDRQAQSYLMEPDSDQKDNSQEISSSSDSSSSASATDFIQVSMIQHFDVQLASYLPFSHSVSFHNLCCQVLHRTTSKFIYIDCHYTVLSIFLFPLALTARLQHSYFNQPLVFAE